MTPISGRHQAHRPDPWYLRGDPCALEVLVAFPATLLAVGVLWAVVSWFLTVAGS